MKAAGMLRESVRFAHHAKEHTDHGEGVVLFRAPHMANKFEVSALKYDGSADASALKQFIQKNM